jgi:hypothetical protein
VRLCSPVNLTMPNVGSFGLVAAAQIAADQSRKFVS